MSGPPATSRLGSFDRHRFMLWPPRVPEGFLTTHLAEIDGLELVVKRACTNAIDELRCLARRATRDTGNPFFRALRILEHLRR